MADVSESVGFGLWQVPVVLVSFYRGVPSAMLMMVINFAAPRTSFWCYNSTRGEDDVSAVGSDPPSNVTALSSQCFVAGANGSIKCDAWVYDHSTFSRTLIEEWDMVCDRNWLRSLTQSVYLVGMFFGNLVFSHLSDRYGRKITTLLTSLVMLTSGVACSFSSSFIVFNIIRFITSLGTGGAQSTSVTLFVETVPSRYRTFYVISCGCGWVLGQLALTAVAYAIRDWRYLQLACAMSSLPLVIVCWHLPESPRWLLTRGERNKAICELRRAAAMNKTAFPEMSAFDKSVNNEAEVT